MVQPEEEGNLDKVVKGNEFNEEERHLFDNGKSAEYNPVGEPLCAHVTVGRVDRLERHVGWVDKAKEVRDQLGSADEVHEKAHDGVNSEKEKDLGVSKLFFELLHSVCVVQREFGVSRVGGIAAFENLGNGIELSKPCTA